MDRTYLAIDLKSFYASVEAVDAGKDPLTTHLVVADISRTDKTICLAVSPSLKAYGLPGRARLFEIRQAVKKINAERLLKAPGHRFKGKSADANELAQDPSLELDFIIATPRMSRYLEVSSKIYSLYLRYISKEDIDVYSIDEVFLDATGYLRPMGLTPKELASKLVSMVKQETGITATAGIGTNLYLAKVAMDVLAKHAEPDGNGVRMASLNEEEYRTLLWDHRPLRDFWRVGPGIEARLSRLGLFTMGDICRQSLVDEDVLFEAFGVNAELLIDHAWGEEPTTIRDIHSYSPKQKCLSSGQVLSCPEGYQKGLLLVKEMGEEMAMELTRFGVMCSEISLTLSFDRMDVDSGAYHGATEKDRYGRVVPKSTHGSLALKGFTSSARQIREAVAKLYARLMDPKGHLRRIGLTAFPLKGEEEVLSSLPKVHQGSLFEDFSSQQEKEKKKKKEEKRELAAQKAMLEIKKKYGKNAVVKGMDLEEGAKTMERNAQIGGHRA